MQCEFRLGKCTAACHLLVVSGSWLTAQRRSVMFCLQTFSECCSTCVVDIGRSHLRSALRVSMSGCTSPVCTCCHACPTRSTSPFATAWSPQDPSVITTLLSTRTARKQCVAQNNRQQIGRLVRNKIWQDSARSSGNIRLYEPTTQPSVGFPAAGHTSSSLFYEFKGWPLQRSIVAACQRFVVELTAPESGVWSYQ